ncbi:MAG TPA: NADH:ubiquinone oxidoreductase [Noviherbaspirillum sp.]|uniref:NADH-quinone oxidoreductase subunit B family protein n=1 Tax=Noviherbaspirillum sp. TaxID=1926288 RepID=UPI002B488E2F|nr:NADH:ubiquinone oxidoreductase [Noviherbaspirillum sp.]HJV84596.1 NADH:ubiquinone oxidoreductase [Noviherbaspirillum sp.]
MTTLFWLQTAACGGDTLALLSATCPSVEQLLSSMGVELLWHPSLSYHATRHRDETMVRIIHGELHLGILCVEGSIVTAPHGTGLHDTCNGRAKLDVVRDLAEHADLVVAVGTCAAFGGMPAAQPNAGGCIGLQFDHDRPGGLFSADWRSRGGLPVINISGCPAHPHAITQTLAWLAAGAPLVLDELNRPTSHFSRIVHQGCTRNEYHEYNIEDTCSGDRACLFFNLGCQGPLTRGMCNSDLWNGASSKTRVGVPCFGCTSPDFPRDGDLLCTEKLGEVPLHLPLGVERARYMAYKNLARAAAPERVRNKKMEP